MKTSCFEEVLDSFQIIFVCGNAAVPITCKRLGDLAVKISTKVLFDKLLWVPIIFGYKFHS